jgi:hypothetical protein
MRCKPSRSNRQIFSVLSGRASVTLRMSHGEAAHQGDKRGSAIMVVVNYYAQIAADRIVKIANALSASPAITGLSDGAAYMLVWEENNDIRFRTGSAAENFSPQTGVTLNTTTAGVQRSPAIATLANGDAITVFTDASANANAPVIRAIRATANGTAVGPDIVIGTGDGFDGNFSPSVAVSGERFATVWVDRDGENVGDDLYLSVYGQLMTPVTVNRPLTTSLATEANPDIAALRDLGRYVVVWDEKPIFSSTRSIYASIISNDGATTVVPRFSIGSADWPQASNPSVIGLANGGFAVAYTAVSSASPNSDIVVSTFTATGQQQTTTRLTSTDANAENSPDLLEMPDGRLVVSYDLDGFLNKISKYVVFEPASGQISESNDKTGIDTALAKMGPNNFIVATFNENYATFPGDQDVGDAVIGRIGNISRQTFGTPMNDFVTNYYSLDFYYGYEGVDAIRYTGLRSDYNVTTASGAFIGGFVRAKSVTLTAADQLSLVERAVFDNGVLALDIQLPNPQGVMSNAGSAYRLYEAAFNRAPDNPGLAFWIKAIDGGVSAVQAAQGFVNSSEFQGIYGANPGATQLVTQFYQNILDRAPEKAGLDFWVGVLEGKPENRALVLEGIANSFENQNALFPVIGQGIFVPGNLLL